MTNLKSKSYNLGLIGYPIDASISPKIHKIALKEIGLKGEYKLYPIPPDDLDALGKILNHVRDGKIDGLNITIPHKQNVIPLVDKLSDSAKIIGAVNTILLKDGHLIGENTDAPGFWDDLQNLIKFSTNSSSKALVLGAGGAARAISYALLNAGWDIIIATRQADIEQAQTLKNDFLPYFQNISTCLLEKSALSPLSPALIVNTTPVGMKSHHTGSPWIENLPFPKNAMLYDVIYNPSQTQLMQDASKAGLPTRGGIGMLVGQALLSFEIWTGRKVSSEKIKLKFS